VSKSQQQLEFIRLLSLDSEIDFTKTMHFSFAMKKLSVLLDTPFFTFTLAYNDIQNKKSQYILTVLLQPIISQLNSVLALILNKENSLILFAC
jgi:hypothetical protein